MPRPRKPLLSLEEIRRPYEGSDAEPFPSILSIDRVAEMLDVGVGTIREWLRKGRLDGTFRRRGKRLFFWRDKVLDTLFNGPAWETAPRDKH